MKNKIITAFLGLSILTVHAEKIIVPLSNTMGRSCFGHLYATDTLVDFYTEYFDCPKMHYYKATQEVIAFNYYEEPRRYDTRTFFITKKMPTCPFEIISFLEGQMHQSQHIIIFIALSPTNLCMNMKNAPATHSF